MTNLQPGLSATLSQTVTQTMTASHVGSGAVAVLATPEVALLFEKAAVAVLREHLPEGQTSVGTKLSFSHLAPTPVGMTVSVTAALIDVDGRKLTFDLLASDEVEPIARGTHTRFLVDKARFMRKAQEKGRYTV
ncbi:MAG TPA: thioesterase [Anaerolineae bacterium]|nr:thioesterase [Anaerolineae bacterium]